MKDLNRLKNSMVSAIEETERETMGYFDQLTTVVSVGKDIIQDVRPTTDPEEMRRRMSMHAKLRDEKMVALAKAEQLSGNINQVGKQL